MFETGAYGYLSDYLWWYVAIASLFLHTWCFFRFYPSKGHRRLRLVAGNALIALCLLSVAGLVAETYLRFVSVRMDGFGASLTAQRWHRAYARLNSLNCRDREWAAIKPDGVRRIAFIGDSVTYGWGLEDPADRFTDLIQRRFDDRAPGSIEIMNVAWPNWDTDRHITALRTVIAEYDVDEVVLCYFPNDLLSLMARDRVDDPRGLPDQYLLNTRSSFLLDDLYHRLATRWFDAVRHYCDRIADGYADPEVWAGQQAQLDTFIDLGREQGVLVRVALLPFLRVWGERFDGPKIHAQLSSFFVSRGVEVVDVLPALRGREIDTLVVNAVDPHPNERAHAIFAEAIWTAFYERVVIPTGVEPDRTR